MTKTLSARSALIGLLACTTLSACNAPQRLATLGQAPPLSPIENISAPQRQASVAQQGLVGMDNGGAYRAGLINSGAGNPQGSQPTSLWRTGAKAFFKDQRASQVGDILTVMINIDDRADLGNNTSRTRTNSENIQLPAFLGLESQLDKVLPNSVNPSNLVNGQSQARSSGGGEVQRSETVELTVAAIVSHVLPNGNLIIQGRQEVRVNFEVRELVIAGVVRPEDITRDNTVQHTQIAEARIAYGGRGQLTDVQQARYGQQLFDILMPF